MDDEKKWILSTGSVVEDKLYEYACTKADEHLSHSFILDVNDATYVKDGVFTTDEISEIHAFEPKAMPKLPDDLMEYLKSFEVNTTQELRSALYKAHPWQLDFDFHRSSDFDWIHQTFFAFARMLESGALAHSHLESWYNAHVWRMIDTIFDDIPDIEVARGEATSTASANRKNANRSDHHERKKFGRKLDLIIKLIRAHHEHAFEFGGGEVGKLYEQGNGTKPLAEAGLKLPKVLKDMLADLIDSTDNSIDKARKLETLGLVSYGLSLTMLRLDFPCGYVCRLTRTNSINIITSTCRQTCKSLIQCLCMIWMAKAMIVSTKAIVEDVMDKEENWIQNCIQVTQPNSSNSFVTQQILPPTFSTPQNNRVKRIHSIPC
ncbi:hypothetical protein DM01DRAFT_1049958 [Hesseltinella vesiculosa]|uniref:Uncharacterized protein n=1 Tax=Hesseltinella vesiculosa TaxID=101127 RepID=A0A1X2GG49_9FUNG|nr:hypothetical protein DM01DRAFT_1049958 [Hesseltinella vesiculosa]